MHPLQLNSYIFSVIEVVANPNFDPEALTIDIAGNVNIDGRVGLLDNENPGEFGVTLDVREIHHSDVELPYTIRFEVYGAFSLQEKFSTDEKTRKTAFHNAASLLYSAARDFILTVTSRGPWGGYLLPTHTLIIGDKIEGESEKVSGSAKKPKRTRKQAEKQTA